MSSGEQHEKVRLDKWLWAARFFKTRALAAEAIGGGHVHIHGARAKPGRGVHVGDRLTVRKGPYEFDIEVLGLAERRGPAKEAEQLYRESAESRARRESLAEQRRVAAQSAPSPSRRPDKKARRQIRRFTRGE